MKQDLFTNLLLLRSHGACLAFIVTFLGQLYRLVVDHGKVYDIVLGPKFSVTSQDSEIINPI